MVLSKTINLHFKDIYLVPRRKNLLRRW